MNNLLRKAMTFLLVVSIMFVQLVPAAVHAEELGSITEETVLENTETAIQQEENVQQEIQQEMQQQENEVSDKSDISLSKDANCICEATCVTAEDVQDCIVCAEDIAACSLQETSSKSFCDCIDECVASCVWCLIGEACEANMDATNNCVCALFRCQEGLLDETCLDCTIDYNLCKGMIPRTCNCNVYCETPNMNCSVCSIDSSLCAKSCTCLFKCTEDSIDETCASCAKGNIKNCAGWTEPTCICDVYKCGEGLAEPKCIVCTQDIGECKGTRERICICVRQCDGITDQEICSVCSIDPVKCVIPKCVCDQTIYSCTSTDKNPDCKACQQKYTVCKSVCWCVLDVENVCTELNQDEYCLVCQADYTKCQYEPDDFEQLKKVIENDLQSKVGFRSHSMVFTDSIIVDSDVTLYTFDNQLDVYGAADLTRAPSLQSKPLFQIIDGGNLTIKNIVLSGNNNYLTAAAPLVQVEQGGTLILAEGAVLEGNENSGIGGGLVADGGTVIMENDAIIRGNQAGEGAGVLLIGGAVMQIEANAKVVNNESMIDGGGILCQDNSQILLSGNPQIISNTAAGASSNMTLAKDALPAEILGLSKTATIGVSSMKEGYFAKKSSEITNMDVSVFNSDNGEYIISDGKGLSIGSQIDHGAYGKVLLNGNPIQNAKVTILDKASGVQLAQTTTDKTGAYFMTLTNKSELCRILVSVKLGGEYYGAILDAMPSYRSMDLFPDISLQKGILVSGSFVNGLDGIEVFVEDLMGKKMASTYLYGGGLYDLVVMSTGEYIVNAIGKNESGSGRIQIDENGNVTGSHITMGVGKLAKGKIVYTDGSPAIGATVTFTPESKASLSRIAVLPVATAFSNNKGEFTVGGLSENVSYVATAFSADKSKIVTVKGITVVNDNILSNGQNVITLSETKTLTGTAYYFKSILDMGEALEYPQNLSLRVYTDNGLQIAQTDINPNDGTFTLEGVGDGQYRISIVSQLDETVHIDSESAIMKVQDGNFKIIGGDSRFSADSYSPDGVHVEFLDNTVFIHQTYKLSDVWVTVEYFLDLDEQNFDFTNPKLMNTLNQINVLYKSCNIIERDMLPSEIYGKLQRILAKLAKKYKIKVTTNNDVPKVISVCSSLGLDENVS